MADWRETARIDHQCAQAGCSRTATHLVVESHALALLFKSGAGLMCKSHAEEMESIGGINLGWIDEVARAIMDYEQQPSEGGSK